MSQLAGPPIRDKILGKPAHFLDTPGVTNHAGRKQDVLICLLLFVVTVALYWPALRFDFVQYDDSEYVFENKTVQAGITAWGIAWSFVDSHAANWHPLTWLSHMLDCQLFGLKASGHHLTSILIHGASSAFLFVLLLALTGARLPSAFSAMVFAWHPLRVESVAWISERKDVLSGLFFMLTLMAYVRFVRSVPTASSDSGIVTVPSTSRAKRYFALALVFFFLGLLAKPMLVTLPVILLLLDYWPLKRFLVQPRPILADRKVLVEKAPFFILSALVGIITVFAQRAGGAVVSIKSESLTDRLANTFAGYLQYLGKVFWPSDLSIIYLRPESAPITLALGGLVVVSLISVVVVALRKSHPAVLVGWGWFVVMLGPVIGLVQVGLQSIADRYTYLPSIGLTLALVWGCCGAGGAAGLVVGKRRVGFALAAAVVLVACLALTRQQLSYWQNTESLMSRALELNPGNYVAHHNLALYYARIGKTAEAMAHRQRVRELDPQLRASQDPLKNPAK